METSRSPLVLIAVSASTALWVACGTNFFKSPMICGTIRVELIMSAVTGVALAKAKK